MYCLPFPRDSGVAPLRVPYVASSTYLLSGPYDFSGFCKIATEAEVQFLKSQNSSLPLRSPWAAIAQSWLFFGLASEALGRDVAHHEFIETNTFGTAGASIDLRIPRFFFIELKRRWKSLRNTLSVEEYERKKNHVIHCFTISRVMLGMLDLQTEYDDADVALVFLSIHMLLYIMSDVFSDQKLLQASQQLGSTQFLMKRMVESGWCRKRLNFVEMISLFQPSLYFLSSLQPPQGEKEDHRSCDSRTCTVRGRLLQPFHRTAECLCQTVHVPLEQVTEIVAAGGIPLIRITRSDSGSIELEVVPYERTSRFTAISHVWADRQFGSTENGLPKCQIEYLDTVLAALPRQVEHWRAREWLPNRFVTPVPTGKIQSPSRTYDLFWLDTFCIPQAEKYADLRSKAIESMNLIYAAASQTLVFDAGLQRFDAGQRPAALSHGGQPSYYSPSDESLLDVLGQFCASNWMGRAWTLQEGVLSGSLVFPLDGSLAYLKLLWPHFDAGISFSDVQWAGRKLRRKLRRFLKSNDAVVEEHTSAKEVEIPFQNRVRNDLFVFAKASLNVEEYDDYARGPTERAARYVKSHGLLQSRSTTQADDLPLILVNMSGMNGNAISQCKNTGERMKLLFYGLEHLPVELLFSECKRIGCCEVDSWIPLEIVPEKFSQADTLQLGPEGFEIHLSKTKQPYEFSLLPASTNWDHQVLLLLHNKSDNTQSKYLVEATNPSNGQSPTTPKNGWCILSDNGLHPRGARFAINRIVGNKVFLYFDCPVRLSSSDMDDSKMAEQRLSNMSIALPADSQREFIIEKSSTPQSLGMSRPQNPAQYSDRLVVINQALWSLLSYFERKLMERFLPTYLSENTPFLILWGIVSYRQLVWVEQAVQAFVHYAWVETYQPTWSANGPWKLFWTLSNYEPPVPFRTMNKWMCTAIFFLSLQVNLYSGMLQISLYWCIAFPKDELVNLYITALLWKCFSWVMGW